MVRQFEEDRRYGYEAAPDGVDIGPRPVRRGGRAAAEPEVAAALLVGQLFEAVAVPPYPKPGDPDPQGGLAARNVHVEKGPLGEAPLRDAPEQAWKPWQERTEQRLAIAGILLADGNGCEPTYAGFDGGGHRAGIIHIRSEIVPPVGPGQDKVRDSREQGVRPDPHAVGRSPANGPFAGPTAIHGDALPERDGMAAAAPFHVRGHDIDLRPGEFARDCRQRVDARGIEPVVICDEDDQKASPPWLFPGDAGASPRWQQSFR